MTTSVLDALAPHGWPLFALLTARVLGVALIAPLWSMATISPRLRAGFVIVLSLVLAPSAAGGAAPEATLLLPVAVGAELLIGLAIGLTASLFVQAVAIAGDVAAVQMGLSIASVYDPATESTVTQIAQLTTFLTIALYTTLGGPLILVRTLADTIVAIPLGTVAAFDTGTHAVLLQTSSIFGSAVRLAAPLMAAMFLANVGLAILTKAVPQISAFMVAFPATIGLGLVVLAASLPGRGTLVREWMSGLPALLDRTLGAFVPAVVR